MATEVKLPEVGDNIEQGNVVAVLVKSGDTIQEGQAIIEIETDKAVVEVPSTASGTVQEVRVKEGESVQVGGVILTLAGSDAATPAPTQAAGAAPAAPSRPASAAAAPAPVAASAPESETALTLPDVGDNIEQGNVVAVLVKVGDSVSEGQGVIELETDKAVVEVPATASGTVKEIRVKEGDSLPIGGVILTLAGAGGAAITPAQVENAPGSALGATGQGAETDEATAVAPQPDIAARVAAGQQANLKEQAQSAPAPSSTPVGSTPPGSTPQAAPAQAVQTFEGRPVVHAAPSVRRFARELGVDLSQVQGTGLANRISEEDVRRSAGQPSVAPAPAAPAGATPAVPTPVAPAPSALPDFSKYGPVRTEDMSGIRKATVRSMTQAWTTIPMVTHFDKADVTRMEEVRKQFAARVEKAGGKLTMTSILMKVVANALRRFPKFGASIDVANNQIIYKDFVNLGIAVDTQNGLLVPVIKNADRKSITELSVEIGEIAQKARDRKLRPDEMQGATFSISNLGGIGGHAFTPIVNPPEVAILGVSRGGFEPVWNKDAGTFEPRNMLPVSLTYDHRLIDGADAARFVRFICESLEDPFLISL
ncbi:2-oxo acid dehydrogenase subunit E2 [Deinococcus peraridilitoris]|uniref:Dihydrolipoamide acetyltransferase component of pyruvate dehydrogenase complex n=1 Tax=Deinococcus peraridilitoris (strain DSM 19664 / LMG 22246 / CIP 109416 / KR-200) TaxID=937777 RepID=L0A4Y8_DEIPD|nr:2-oxo acid dehydrogenase subunit E2 [Deinococcus peraridilitoris]AFZ68237.1 pyruvate/2-oxoglutarate dehydrogenase complex, dihydrolipoamide acyltransferase component [Deinococcus peraridilitoris DSM 19664]